MLGGVSHMGSLGLMTSERLAFCQCVCVCVCFFFARVAHNPMFLVAVPQLWGAHDGFCVSL